MENFISWLRYGVSIKNIVYVLCFAGLIYVGYLNSDRVKLYGKGVSNYFYIVSKYIKYEYRELTFGDDDLVTLPVAKSWVNIEGFTEDGKVAIRRYSEKGIETVAAELADLEIVDARKAAYLVKGFIRQQAEVDYYEYNKDGEVHRCVVVWLPDGRPLNQLLIENGAATPTINPPTNIVNKLMATYYKGLL